MPDLRWLPRASPGRRIFLPLRPVRGSGGPVSAEKAREFCRRFDTVYVVEEGEPFIEEYLRIHGIYNIVGKEKVPLMGELNPEILDKTFHGTEIPKGFGDEISQFRRGPRYCAWDAPTAAYSTR